MDEREQPSLELQRAAERVGRATGAEAVILFGSFARRQENENSDIDLLYIVSDDADLTTLAALAERSLWPRHLPIDLVPMRHSHWLERRSSLARRAAQEGVVLYVP